MLKFEPLEVLDILTDVNDSEATAVIGRFIISQQNDSVDKAYTFFPLDPNILQIPIVGEVLIGTEFLGKYYYMSKLNFQNSPVANTRIGISEYASKSPEFITLGKYFRENELGSKKLITREGDTILQGRFGNSIRLGSNQSEDYFTEPLTNNFTNSPNLKLVSGITDNGSDNKLYYQEDLNTEVNSIYLTTKEKVSFKFNDDEIENVNNEPQITIQSDNIVFHGRKKFNVHANEVNLGGTNTEPVVLGNKLKDLLKDTLDLLNRVITSYSSANPGATIGLTQEKDLLNGRLEEILSSKVNTE